MNINEKIVPILANKDGKPGIAFKNTETGEVSGWTAKGDISPDQKTKLDAYNTKQGQFGYRLDTAKFKRDTQQQAAAIQRQQNLDKGSRRQGETTADFHRRLRQQLDTDKPATGDRTGSSETGSSETGSREVKQPVAKTYDVDGEKLTKAQINTRYNELRKQAGGLQPGSSAEKFGMSANQAIFGKNFAKPKTPNPMMTKYKHPSVEEAYDVVLDYLLSEGHAETVEEAHYVMMQLDSEYVQSIVEAGLPIPPGGIKPDRLNPIDPATGKSMYKVVPGASGKPKEIRNPSFGKLPPA